ncbi:hypothetical protein [Tahibacter caeni]|uniref:hypothetical protein n=1 Tax=Tahibacter caeni TaxID=1453545 RepID=UPI0021486241|nr:hypothetical protein [Tahibacter caeni]
MHRRPYLRTGLLAVLSAAGATAPAADYPADSGWSTFWGSFVDEVVGAPRAEALQAKARFAEAGIAFDYPAVLRVTYDAEDSRWRLWRGDFEFEVHAGSYSESHAQTLLEMMGSVLHRGDTPAVPEAAAALHLCGRDVPGWRVRLHFLGDIHDYLAYDLPLGDGDSRLFLFDDVVRDGKPSATHAAAFDAWRGSLRCTAGG